MESKVKGHYVHRHGKRIWIPSHEMHVNPEVHERHERRLREEIKELEEMEHEHRRRVRV